MFNLNKGYCKGVLLCMLFMPLVPVEWGFYSHRLINRMAVFTLPKEVLPLYKANISYISNHAVDPDKRRYAARLEGIRHYIDLDQWGSTKLSAQLADEVFSKASFSIIDLSTEDTLGHLIFEEIAWATDTSGFRPVDTFKRASLWDLIEEGSQIIPWSLVDTLCLLRKTYGEGTGLFMSEKFSRHGILPYHLIRHQGWLEHAFMTGDLKKVIRLSADLGHYIADAHVPLHTTTNYNGQLTGQKGIHAFWESRIPELFAENEYDFLFEEAKYIPDMDSFFWAIVIQSHALVDSVLTIEKRLAQSISADRQSCFDERGGMLARLPCEAYARKYQNALNGMVERRMRAAIYATGCAWYTAWCNGGHRVKDEMKVLPLHEINQISARDSSLSPNNDRFVRTHENN